jgi:YVTN family beta-propeller protein
MKENSDKTFKWQTRTIVLGITLALLMLVGIAEAAPFAYVTNYGGNNVSVIDTETSTVKATVSVGNGPNGIAVIPEIL